MVFIWFLQFSVLIKKNITIHLEIVVLCILCKLAKMAFKSVANENHYLKSGLWGIIYIEQTLLFMCTALWILTWVNVM